jgi:hypothetical protein
VTRSLDGAAEGLDAALADGTSVGDVQEDDAQIVDDVLGKYLETRAVSSEAVNAVEGNAVVAQETAEYGSEPNEVGEQTAVEPLSEATHGPTVSELGSSERKNASQSDEPSTSEPAPTSPLLEPSSSDHAPPSQVPESTPPEPEFLLAPSPVDPIEAARRNWELFKPPAMIDLRSRVRKAWCPDEERTIPAVGTAEVSVDVSHAADVMEAADVMDAVGEPLPGVDAKQGAPEQIADVIEAADGPLPGETPAEGAAEPSADVMEAADAGVASSSRSESGSDVIQAGDEDSEGMAAVLDAPGRGADVMEKAGEAIHRGPEPGADVTDSGEFPPRGLAVSDDADDVADVLRRDVGQAGALPVEEVDEGVSVRGPGDGAAEALGAAERGGMLGVAAEPEKLDTSRGSAEAGEPAVAQVVFHESQLDDGQSGGVSTGQHSIGCDATALCGPSSGALEASGNEGVAAKSRLEGTLTNKERGSGVEDEVVAAGLTLEGASSDGEGETGSELKRSREAVRGVSTVERAFSDENEGVAAGPGLEGGFHDRGNELQGSQEGFVTGSPSEVEFIGEGVVAGPASVGASTNGEAEGIIAGSSLEGASSDEEGGTETEVEDGLAGSGLEVGSTDEEGDAEADLLGGGETDAEQWERNVLLCRWRMFNHEVAVLVGEAAEGGKALTVEVGCFTL